MNPNHELERVFPLSGGSPERVALRAPRLATGVIEVPRDVIGMCAFLRGWAAPPPTGTAASQPPMGGWHVAPPSNHGQDGRATC